jgi:hypothetical protein
MTDTQRGVADASHSGVAGSA